MNKFNILQITNKTNIDFLKIPPNHIWKFYKSFRTSNFVPYENGKFPDYSYNRKIRYIIFGFHIDKYLK